MMFRFTSHQVISDEFLVISLPRLSSELTTNHYPLTAATTEGVAK